MKRRSALLIVFLPLLLLVVVVFLILWGIAFRSTITEKMGNGINIPPEVREQMGTLSQGIQRIREAVVIATENKNPQAALSKDTAAALEKKLRSAVARPTTWTDYTASTPSYRVSYPSHWTRDVALSGEASFFVRDPNGAFLWITIPALAFDNDAPNPVKHSFSIDGKISATRIDADGITTVTFFYHDKEGLIRIEYNSEETATYRPIIDRIIQSFTFQTS